MTEDQKTMAKALALCTFMPGIGTKRFARDMAALAVRPSPPDITSAQAEYLRTAVIRFRRQIPAEVVALAERLGVQS